MRGFFLWCGLETAVADSCIARHAKSLSSNDCDTYAQMYDEYLGRANTYRQYYDPEQQLMVPWSSVSGKPIVVDARSFDRSLNAYEDGTPLQYTPSCRNPHSAVVTCFTHAISGDPCGAFQIKL